MRGEEAPHVAASSAARAAEDGVPIRVCAPPEQASLSALALERPGAVRRDDNRYVAIRHPFGKLDLIAVPDFPAGALENTAAIFFRQSDLLADARTASLSARKNIASTIVHEMAHERFGDPLGKEALPAAARPPGIAAWLRV